MTIRLEKRKRGRRVELRGKLTDQGTVGNNKTTIRRFAGRKLALGPYRLELLAKDAAGNRSVEKRIGFRIRSQGEPHPACHGRSAAAVEHEQHVVAGRRDVCVARHPYGERALVDPSPAAAGSAGSCRPSG